MLVNLLDGLATDNTLQAVVAALEGKLEASALEGLATAARQDAAREVLEGIRAVVEAQDARASSAALLAAVADVEAALAGKLEAADLAPLATTARQDAQQATLGGILDELQAQGLKDPSVAVVAALGALRGSLESKLEPADLAALATAAKQDAQTAALNALAVEVAQKLEPADLAGLATGARQEAQKAVLDNLLLELAQKVEPADLASLATAANQATQKAVLDAISTKLGGTLAVTVGNLPATQPVSAAALPLPSGAAKDATVSSRFGGGKVTQAVTISTAGENVILTPPSGKRVRLYWLGLSTSQENTAEVGVAVKFGSSTIYRWAMGNPGAFSHWEPVEGAVDQPLVIALSAAQPVAVNVTWEAV